MKYDANEAQGKACGRKIYTSTIVPAFGKKKNTQKISELLKKEREMVKKNCNQVKNGLFGSRNYEYQSGHRSAKNHMSAV